MKYKETGVEWLGKVPEDWKVDRLKDNSTIVTGNTPSKKVSENYENGTIPWVKPENLRGKFIEDSTEKLTEKGLISARLIPENSILVGCIGDIGNYAVSKVPLTTNQQINSVIFDQKKVHFSYGRYIIESSRGEHWKNSTIVVVSILNKSRQGIIQIPVPPLNEQIAIANYLDKACERIDKIIKLKEEQLLKMEANKQSLIKEFVTGKKTHKTHNEYVSSNIEWLGDIPKSWKLKRLFNISHFVRGNSSFKKDELLEEGKYVALQYGKTYKVEEVNEKFKFFVNDDFYKSSQIVNFGDVIFVSTSETLEDLGHSVFYNRNDIGLIGGEQILIKPKNTIIDGKYLFYTTKVFGKELRKFATGLKVFRFDSYDLKNIYVPVPPLNEQRAIAEHLDNSIEKTKKIKIIIQNQIKTLKIYRKSLIHEYVTGKKLIEKHTNKA